jgi:hypothetical protein
MTIKQIKNLTDNITNKYQNGYLSGQEFNDLFRAAETSYQNFLIGNLHQFRATRTPVSMVGLDMTKSVVERLSPFRVTITATVGDTGEVSKSSNIAAVEAINKEDGTRVKFVHPNRLSYYLNSVVWDLASNPIYVDYDTYWKFYPDTIEVVITAITTPPHSKWAFTTVGDREMYDNINSVDPIWKDADCLEIVGRMCKLIGVALKDGELMQFGQGITLQGE